MDYKKGDKLTTEQAADYLQRPVATLKYWRVNSIKKGPPYIKHGDGSGKNRVFYRYEDLVEYEDRSTHLRD